MFLEGKDLFVLLTNVPSGPVSFNLVLRGKMWVEEQMLVENKEKASPVQRSL